jgi:hypothetical protein
MIESLQLLKIDKSATVDSYLITPSSYLLKIIENSVFASDKTNSSWCIARDAP